MTPQDTWSEYEDMDQITLPQARNDTTIERTLLPVGALLPCGHTILKISPLLLIICTGAHITMLPTRPR